MWPRTASGLVLIALTLSACTGSGSDLSTPLPRPTPEPETTTTTSTQPSGRTSSTVAATDTPVATLEPDLLEIESFPVPSGSRPHDVAPAADGGVWYTAQNLGELGWLDPVTGETHHIPLGPRSRPHGVIVDDEGTAWITDGGQNAIVSVDPETEEVTVYPLPPGSPNANLNTAVFDLDGRLWFTGQAGIYGSLDTTSGEIVAYDSPRGGGPYGVTVTPGGSVFYASLAGSYVGAVGPDGTAEVLEPPTDGQGARRVWSDSAGDIWVSEWNSGNVSRYQPGTRSWTTWHLPGDQPAAYAVYVDERDIVWLSDFGGNAIVRFDPTTEEFHTYPLPHDPGNVRQIHGRPGEVWGAESAADHLIVIRTG